MGPASEGEGPTLIAWNWNNTDVLVTIIRDMLVMCWSQDYVTQASPV
jgi:hypothetical protein